MRILIIKLSSLGDLFHALPAVHVLKTGLEAEIDWIVNRDYVELVKHFDDVSRVIPFHRHGFFSHLKEFRAELWREEYDYVIDLQGLLKSALVTRMARARLRIGPSFHREGSRLFYSAVAGKVNRDRHAVEQNLDVARYLGLQVGEPRFPITFPMRDVIQEQPRVALLPFSRWPTKNWPAKCFVELGKRLKEVSGASLFLLGGKEDAGPCAEIAQALGGDVENLAGKLSLVETGGLLEKMNLLVANDSGPLHMAAALGIPVIAVLGPTDPVRTGPFGQLDNVASVNLDCRPCFSRTCRRDGIPCLAGVTPERVGEMACDILKKGA